MKLARFSILLVFLMALLPVAVGAQELTYDSGIQVQNLSADTVANVTLAYVAQDGTKTEFADTIQPNSSNTYFPIHPEGTFNGSVVISGDQPIAAISNLVGDMFSFGAASYGGFSEGAAEVSLPLIMKNNSGFNTWFNVQNTGTEPANITVTYSNGTTETSNNVPAGAAVTFKQATNTALGDVFVGSAVVTSAQPIVAAAVQIGPDTMFAYNGFIGGSVEVVMPLINANNSGYITGVQIQNTGSAPTDVTVQYVGGPYGGTDCTETKTIPAGQSATFALYSFTYGGALADDTTCTLGEKFIGSASVLTNTAAQPLVAIVNQLNIPGAKGAAYNAFNPAVGTETVLLPLIMDRNSGFFTGYSIVNVGAAATKVTCTYSGAVTRTDEATLAPGEAMAPYNDGSLGAGYVGSASCAAETGGKIVGVVNQLNMGMAGDSFMVYEGFNN